MLHFEAIQGFRNLILFDSMFTNEIYDDSGGKLPKAMLFRVESFAKRRFQRLPEKKSTICLAIQVTCISYEFTLASISFKKCIYSGSKSGSAASSSVAHLRSIFKSSSSKLIGRLIFLSFLQFGTHLVTRRDFKAQESSKTNSDQSAQ